MRLQVCQLSMDVIQKYSNTRTISLKSLFLLLIGRHTFTLTSMNLLENVFLFYFKLTNSLKDTKKVLYYTRVYN